MKKSIIISAGAVAAAVFGGGLYSYLPDNTQVVSETAPLALAKGSKSSKGAKSSSKSSSKPAADAPAQLPKAIGDMPATAWLEPEEVQSAVGEKILQGIQDATPEQVAEFIKKPENRLLLAQWMLAQHLIDSRSAVEGNAKAYSEALDRARTALEGVRSKLPAGDNAKLNVRQKHALTQAELTFTEAQTEANAPHTIQELVGVKGGKPLLEAVTNNPDWLEQIVFTGEDNNPGKTLGILATIMKKYPDFAMTTMSRDIATATAMEYGRYNWNVDRAVKRYNYFNTHQKAGDLNIVFDSLPFWQRRIVCGAKGDNDFCSVESFEWSLENVKLPQEMYPGACWRCGYKLRNPYGESIHGALYQAPFEEVHGRNRMQFTYDVGGVCGGLSHFGAYSACANGVPALTAGEPGHCAFVVLIGDKWTPAYSLSWERGLHWQVFANVHVFASLHMATDMFKQKEATDISNAYRVIAGEYARKGELNKAQAAYVQAVTRQPNNFYAWREYAQFIKAKAPGNKKAWSTINELVCKHVVPTYPEMAAAILSMHVYDGMKEAFDGDTKGLEAEMKRFWSAAKEMGPDRWRIEQHIGKQMQTLGINDKDAATVIPFARSIVKCLCESPKYLPIAFSWINSVADKFSDEKDRKKLLQACIKSLSGMKGGDDADRVKILAPLVLAAEKAHDMKTFQALRKMFPDEYGKGNANIPQFEPFPGKLVSQGGLVYASSTCNHDAPCEHLFILEPTGGRYHSSKDKDPWIVAELPKQANLSGVVVVLTQHNMQRCFDIRVEISETGKDDDWHEVSATPKPGRVIRVDLQGSNPLAKYVRIKRAGGPEFFHLNGIYVYGKPAA